MTTPAAATVTPTEQKFSGEYIVAFFNVKILSGDKFFILISGS
jgi:hypothetical protein